MKIVIYDTIIVVHSEICTHRKVLKDLFHLFLKKKGKENIYTKLKLIR